MGISVDWADEQKTTIISVVAWPYSWEELHTAWNAVVDIITSRPRLVNLIVEIPDNMGLAILVTDVPFVQVINKVFFHLVPGFCHRGRVVDTLEAAYALVIQAETKNG